MAEELKIKVRYDTDEAKRDLDGLENESTKSAEAQSSAMGSMANRVVKGAAAVALAGYAPLVTKGAIVAKNFMENLARRTPGYAQADADLSKEIAEQESYKSFAREFGLLAGIAKQQGDQKTISALEDMARREANYAKTAAEGESLLANELLTDKQKKDQESLTDVLADLVDVLNSLKSFLGIP